MVSTYTHAPIEKFWKAYRLAKAHHLHLTGHCSEFGLHWRNVETGLDLIGLERIDHGYTVVENPALMTRCAQKENSFYRCAEQYILPKEVA